MIYNVNLGKTGFLDINKMLDVKDIPENRYYKPSKGGLWASRTDCEYGWEQWCEIEMPHWLSKEHAEVEVNNNARTLIINSEDRLDDLLLSSLEPNFKAVYEKPISERSRNRLAETLNWAEVAKHYDVIEFRLDEYYEQQDYLGCRLDCDSVFILNKNVITEIRNPDTITLRSEINKIEIDPGTTRIRAFEFKGYSNVKSVTIPEGVTTIESSAFDDCTNLESLTLPDSLKRIGDWAFSNCCNLKEVILPDGLEHLGNYSFLNYDADVEHRSIMYKGINLIDNDYLRNPRSGMAFEPELAFELIKLWERPDLPSDAKFYIEEKYKFTEEEIAAIGENINNMYKSMQAENAFCAT